MVKKLSFFIAFFTSLFALAQTPCESGMAGEYPCNNYDFMSRVPVSTLANAGLSANGKPPEGSDIWGWTDATTGKEYAIAAMTNSTAFVDISDPLNPIFLGRLDSNAGNHYWRDVKIYNDFAFIVADNVGNHGMQVFDLKKLRNIASPPAVFAADKIYDDVGSCHNIFINEDTAIAYLVGCNNYSGGPNFIDISDPLNPVGLGGYAADGYSHDAQALTYNGPDTDYTGKEIYIGSNKTKIVILDVTDKSNVIKISEIDYSQIGYTHQGWFTEDQRYFILGDETDEQDFGMNTRTMVFDFLDLDNPNLSSTYFGASSAIDHNGYVKGNEFFMASYRAGLRVLDLTNVAASTNSLTEIGYFDTYPADDGTAFNGAWSIYPYFASGNIIINDIERGLIVVRKSGTLHLEEETILEKKFSIYPNPTESNPTIKATQGEQVNSIEVYTILGRKVFSKRNINSATYVLPTDGFVKGIYFVKINAITTKKIVLK